MTTMSLKLPDSLNARLVAESRKRGINKSVLTRDALKAYLDNGQRARKGSVLELAGDLIGKYDVGPGDLATNKKHMEGYGR